MGELRFGGTRNADVTARPPSSQQEPESDQKQEPESDQKQEPESDQKQGEKLASRQLRFGRDTHQED